MADTDPRESYNDWLDEHSDDLERRLPVSEVFGPTIQGEGSHAGRPCYFIRLGGCNLSCKWCDTPYSTGTHGIPLSTVPRHTVSDVAKEIPDNHLVILTGGEPLMHSRTPAFKALLHLLKSKGCEIHVETNGSYPLDPSIGQHIDHITISPKLGVAMAREKDNPSLCDWSDYADKTICKFVVDTDNPDEFIREHLPIAEKAGIPRSRVWVMPQGISANELNAHWADVAQAAANHNINATHRLHTLAWGNQKGH